MNILVVLMDIKGQVSWFHLGQLMVMFIDDKSVYSKNIKRKCQPSMERSINSQRPPIRKKKKEKKKKSQSWTHGLLGTDVKRSNWCWHYLSVGETERYSKVMLSICILILNYDFVSFLVYMSLFYVCLLYFSCRIQKLWKCVKWHWIA